MPIAMPIGMSYGVRPRARKYDYEHLSNLASGGASIGPFSRIGRGKTTAELAEEGNVGQGRMAYEDRVGQRKQNVALRRRAKYLGRSRRMGRRPRKYTSPAYRAVQRHFDAIDRGGGETLPFGSIPIGAFSPPITV
jgi:hypothetical protein